MSRWARVALDLLLPRTCAPCGGALAVGMRSPLCPACDTAIIGPAAAAPGSRTPPPPLASARSLGPYVAGPPGNVLARTIHHLKYRGARGLAVPLGEHLAVHYPFPDDALLVPVPLHVTRLRRRGYNHALLLARVLAGRRRLPLAPRLLERTRATA